MATNDEKQERKVSVSISIRAGSMTQAEAQALEDRVRDVCDDYTNVDVSATRGQERQTGRV